MSINETARQSFEILLGSERAHFNEPMCNHTTFRVGGPADYFLMPQTLDEILEIIHICDREGIPFTVIGNGSNLLVRDKGYRGAILQLFRNWSDMHAEGGTIRAKSGALLSQVAQLALKESYAGLEFAAGIPGTLGGAVTMNAGAYGGEIQNILVEATVMDRTGCVKVLPVAEMEMDYRSSIVKKKKYIVLDALLRLTEGNQKDIEIVMQHLKERRIEKQPLDCLSAGSTFKRPKGEYAGKLIMDAGLRGCTNGGAQVSEKHCGFIINTGNATAEDILGLMETVQEKVLAQFGIFLEPEVKIIGE